VRESVAPDKVDRRFYGPGSPLGQRSPPRRNGAARPVALIAKEASAFRRDTSFVDDAGGDITFKTADAAWRQPVFVLNPAELALDACEG
jgi:hypothetical protein